MSLFAKKGTRTAVCFLLSFFLPFFILCAVYGALRLYPFGDQTLLISDMNNQYISFFAYYKTIFTSGNDFFYSFSKTLGGNNFGFSAYYLFSPLNLLLLLSPDAYLPVAVSILLAIKISLCGLTMYCFLAALYKPGLRLLLFSTLYAFIGYNVTYLFNIMWLDGVYLLPLIALGIHRIVDGQKGLLYTLCLACAILFNYYIGYMLCLFSVIYFLYRLSIGLSGRQAGLNWRKAAWVFISRSLGAGGLSAVVWMPAIASLQGGKAGFTLSSLRFTENFSFPDLFSKLFANTTDWQQIASGLPNIFCGTLAVILVIHYFLNRGVTLGEKAITAALMATLLISFHVNTFNIIWHGFNTPSGFPYRYSFLFSFVLIAIAAREFLTSDGLSVKIQAAYGLAIFTFATVLVFSKSYENITVKSVYLGVFLAVSFTLLLYALVKKPKAFRVILLLVMLLQCTELAANAYGTIRRLQAASANAMPQYTADVAQTEPLIRRIEQNDTGLYRIEKTYGRSNNDPMLFNYKGLSHFSSSEKISTLNFMRRMRLRSNALWCLYDQDVPMTADCLFGVKYLLCDQGSLSKPYQALFTENGVTVYQNPYALPLGYVVSSATATADLSMQNPFEVQHAMLSSMAGRQESGLFTDVPVDGIDCANLEAIQCDGYIRYRKINRDEPGILRYTLTAPNENALYAYIEAPDYQNATVFLNDQPLGAYFDYYRWNILSLGKYAQKKQVCFSIQVTDAYIDISKAHFCYEDPLVLGKYFDILNAQACALTEKSSSHIAGQVQCTQEDALVLFTLPYDGAWHITVDGKAEEPVEAMGALLAVNIGKGSHAIDMRYIPRGFQVGCYLSLISLALVAGSVLYRKKRLRRG